MFVFMRLALLFLLVLVAGNLAVFGQFEAIKADGEKAIHLTTEDEAAIKAVITSFLRTFPKKDIAALEAFWSEKSPYLISNRRFFEIMFMEGGNFSMGEITFGRMSSENGMVRVRANVDIPPVDRRMHAPFTIFDSKARVFWLIKEEEGWKLYRHRPAENDLARRLIHEKSPLIRERMLTDEKELVNPALAHWLTALGQDLNYEITPTDRLEVCRFALALAEKLDDNRDIAETFLGVGSALQRLGKDAEASEAFESSLKSARKMGEDELIAEILQALGGQYRRQYDYTRAARFDDEALKLWLKVNQPRGAVQSLVNLAWVYLNQGRWDESRRSLDEGIRVSKSISDKGVEASVLTNAGYICYNMRDYSAAMDFFQKAQEIRKRLGLQYDTYDVRRADVYLEQGNFAQAEMLYGQSLASFEKTDSKVWMTMSLSGLSHVYSAQGNYRKAIEFEQRSYSISKELYAGTLVVGAKYHLVNSLRNLAVFHNALGENVKSADYLKQLVELTDSLDDPDEILLNDLEIAKIRLAASDFTGALEVAERAAKAQLAARKLIAGDQNWELCLLLGQIYRGLGRSEEAKPYLLKAVSLIEKQRTRIAGGQEERQRFFSEKVKPYQQFVGLSVETKDVPLGFEFAEKAKSRTLLETIESGHSDISNVASLAENERDKLLRGELVSLNTQILKMIEAKDRDPVRINDLQKKLQIKRLEFEDFQNRLYNAHPDLRVKRGEMKPIGLNEAGMLLPDAKSAFMEFVVAEDKTFAFVITKDAAGKPTLKAYPIGINQKDLAARVEKYRSKLAAGDLDFQKQSREFFDLLIKPFDSQLVGKRSLIVVPDGPLWDLPFQALQNGQNRFLVEQASISYAPSLTALREMSRKSKKIDKNTNLELLAFGNPIVGKERSERLQRVFMSEKLDPLPEAERLVTTLGKMYGPGRSKVFIGADAREETAKAEAPKYRIVQFATHGILNNVSPMYSHLVLSQAGNNPNEDGLLEAWEMKDLDLKADMAILSACDTARGRISSGEGMIGMTWAMFIAGAPTTVASQWKVESSSTTELMLEFHRQLLAGKTTKAEALRRAVLKLMKSDKYSHPSYWAGWVMVGNGN